jgi:multiple sugar transport system permease protein
MPLSIGFQNYIKVFENASLGQGLKNTVVLAVITVPLSTLIALLIAVGLNSIKPLRKILQTIFLLPYVTNSIAIGMVFAMIFNVVEGGGVVNDPGLFNRLLGLFGIDMKYWISAGAPWINKIFVMSVYIIWNALPFKILILLGALQSVNKQYYDAAKVDGSSRLTIFTKITVPLISPMLFYVIVTGFIGAFKEYSSVVGIFGEKLGVYGMNTMVGFIYDSLDLMWTGRAAAGAIILFLIIMVVTGIQFIVSKKRVHY